LRNAENIYERTVEIVGTNFPTVEHHLQFKRLDTGEETIHLGVEVNWQNETLTSVDIATIEEHLWSDSKLNVVVRFTDALYEPVSDWSSAFILAADATACGAVRPTPTPTPTVSSSSVSGLVYEDRNSNGAQESEEPGVADAIVQLRGQQTRRAQQEWETRTDSDGWYRFMGVPGGVYELGVQLPPKYNVDGFQWQAVDVSGTGGSEIIVQPLPAPKAGWRLYLPVTVR